MYTHYVAEAVLALLTLINNEANEANEAVLALLTFYLITRLSWPPIWQMELGGFPDTRARKV